MDRAYARDVLERFCSMPLWSSEAVLKEFAALEGAVAHFDGGKSGFVYLPGRREDRVLLVAHADTVWDDCYDGVYGNGRGQSLTRIGDFYMGNNRKCGIGADDRAGCAILRLLKDSGHSLLIVDGEENGQIVSKHIRDCYPELFDELNRHCYVMQFDRRERNNYKVYDLPVSREFIGFIEGRTGYKNAGRSSRTDIVVLCRDVCGVNLSVGYHNEHTPAEALSFEEWYATLELAEALLSGEQRSYPLIKQ